MRGSWRLDNFPHPTFFASPPDPRRPQSCRCTSLLASTRHPIAACIKSSTSAACFPHVGPHVRSMSMHPRRYICTLRYAVKLKICGERVSSCASGGRRAILLKMARCTDDVVRCAPCVVFEQRMDHRLTLANESGAFGSSVFFVERFLTACPRTVRFIARFSSYSPFIDDPDSCACRGSNRKLKLPQTTSHCIICVRNFLKLCRTPKNGCTLSTDETRSCSAPKLGIPQGTGARIGNAYPHESL